MNCPKDWQALEEGRPPTHHNEYNSRRTPLGSNTYSIKRAQYLGLRNCEAWKGGRNLDDHYAGRHWMRVLYTSLGRERC